MVLAPLYRRGADKARAIWMAVSLGRHNHSELAARSELIARVVAEASVRKLSRKGAVDGKDQAVVAASDGAACWVR